MPVTCCTCGSICDSDSPSYTLSGRCFKCDTGELAALTVIHQCAWCHTVLAPTPYNQGKKIILVSKASHGVCKPCSVLILKKNKARRRRVLVRKIAQKFLTPVLFACSSLSIFRNF